MIDSRNNFNSCWDASAFVVTSSRLLRPHRRGIESSCIHYCVMTGTKDDSLSPVPHAAATAPSASRAQSAAMALTAALVLPFTTRFIVDATDSAPKSLPGLLSFVGI
jgi:hypothetical protein